MALHEDEKIGNLRTGKFRIAGTSRVGGSVMWQNAVFTVTAENSDEGVVSIQLKDGNQNNLTEAAVVNLYISSLAGAVEATTGPDGAVVIDTNGVLINTIVTKKNYNFQSDSTGLFDVNITESGAKSFFVNLIHPVSGEIFSSAEMIWT